MPYPSYDRLKPVIIEISAYVLAVSAGMILGLLSFCGMLATYPGLFLATIFAVFAIAIETEIYLKTIRDALQTLTDPQAYEHQVTALYLQEKLKNFDYNRDRLLLTPPTDRDKEKVETLNEVLIIRGNDGRSYSMGFRNVGGKYEEREIQAGNLAHYLREYTSEQFIENPAHIGKIRDAFQSFCGPNVPVRTRDNYPFFIKTYVSQLQAVHELSDYLQKRRKHTKLQTDERKMSPHELEMHRQEQESMSKAITDLGIMTQHLVGIEQKIIKILFNEPIPETETNTLASGIVFNVSNNPCVENTLHLETMTVTQRFYAWVYPKIKADKLSVKEQIRPINKWGMVPFYNLPIESFPESQIGTLADRSYDFHYQVLAGWIAPDREAWQPKLPAHRRNSRFAFVASGLIAATMALGTIYLIIQSVAAIPAFATLSLGLYPITMAMVSIIAGTAYGLMIFSSLYAMLSDNPFLKFYENVRQGYRHDMSLKTKIIFGTTVFLGFLTTFLSLCSSLTWLSIFNKTKPIFKVITFIPNILLTMIIPVFIGLSILPFSIQSISNTLATLEEHPWFNQSLATLTTESATWHFPRSVTELNQLFWDSWVPKFLGITKEEFLGETWQQQVNPFRIFIRLFYEPLKTIIFIGHLISVGVTADQLDMLPQWVASFLYVWPNTVLELFEDWDYIYGGGHLEKHDTVSLLKDHFHASGGHNHDDGITTRFLNILFDPLFKQAARWDNRYRPDGAEDNVQKRYEKLRGLDSQTPMPEVPSYRTQGNHKLFLFKSAMSATAPVNDACCQVRVAV